MKHWNLGNTTVRNPDRIKDGLYILKKYFEGKIWTEREQREFFEKLLEEGNIVSATKSEKSQEISGRKWAACFNQLGLSIAWAKKKIVEITDVGNALLKGNIPEEEIFLRQFLKLRLPSPIESGKDYLGFEVNPFYVILKMLNDLTNENLNGLTKEEISLYVITCVRNQDIDEYKNKIKLFRAEYNSIKGNVKKKEFYFKKKQDLIYELYRSEIEERNKLIVELYQKYSQDRDIFSNNKQDELLNRIIAGGKGYNTKKAQCFKRYILEKIKSSEIQDIHKALLDLFMETKGRTLKDYADTTVRYTIKTGLLTISGNKLVIKEDKIFFVQKILENYPVYIDKIYLDNFYSPAKPQLPSDEVDFIKKNLETLLEKLELLRVQSHIKFKENIDISSETDPNNLRKIQRDSENKLKILREQLFYRKQADSEMIQDILNFYDNILNRNLLGGDAYMPAFLEWNTWRLFLAINQISNEIPKTRNFEIDEEMNPIHHARSGEPDMVFEYPDFVIVCEVTLRTTANQWSEEEPVPRHVGKVIQKYNKNVYGIFIAPSIDPNTIIEFYNKKQYLNGEVKQVNIIPLTIDQIKKILIKFNKQRFAIFEFKNLLEKLIILQKKTEDPMDWYKLTNKELDHWLVINN